MDKYVPIGSGEIPIIRKTEESRYSMQVRISINQPAGENDAELFAGLLSIFNSSLIHPFNSSTEIEILDKSDIIISVYKFSPDNKPDVALHWLNEYTTDYLNSCIRNSGDRNYETDIPVGYVKTDSISYLFDKHTYPIQYFAIIGKNPVIDNFSAADIKLEEEKETGMIIMTIRLNESSASDLERVTDGFGTGTFALMMEGVHFMTLRYFGPLPADEDNIISLRYCTSSSLMGMLRYYLMGRT